MDCGIALLAAKADQSSLPTKPRRVTKPKIFEGALHLRLPPGLKGRIDALRGNKRQGDYVRDLLVRAVEAEEARRGIKPPAAGADSEGNR